MLFTEKGVKDMMKNKLHPGMVVKIEYFSKQKDGTFVCRRRQKGVVEGMYPHIFTVRIGKFLESFRYSQCFEQGHERVRL